MLKSTELVFAYDRKRNFVFPDIYADASAPLLVLGPSGCGKTTLLHLLGGLRKAKKGEILIAGTNITKLSTRALDKFRGEHIGIVFQQSHFIAALSMIENLALAAKLSGAKVGQQQIFDILDRLQLSHRAKAKPNALSQGEKQRAAIARAILHQPKLLLADEPTASLDDANCKAVFELLSERAKEIKAALVIVTHDARLKALVEQHILIDHPSNSQ